MKMRRRQIYRRLRSTGAGLLALTLLATAAPADRADAASIAFFRDTGFVHAGTVVTTADDNMRNALIALGHTVNDFTGVTEAEWVSGLNGNHLIVVPELFGDLAGSMSSNAVAALHNALGQGAGLLVGPGFGSSTPNAGNLLNLAFGLSLVETGGGEASNITTGALGTAFAGGPIALGNFTDIDGLVNSSFGSETVSIYEQIASGAGNSTVALITPGGASGQGAYIGWGWRDPQATDTDWNAVLHNAVIEVAGSSVISIEASEVPAPGAVLLFALGVAGLAATRRRG